jgi:hypothetical protein
LPQPDGILMANALHFVRDNVSFLQTVRAHLKPGSKLLIVEYDIDFGNPFVPYRVSYRRLIDIVQAAGLMEPELLARMPSNIGRRFTRRWRETRLAENAKTEAEAFDPCCIHLHTGHLSVRAPAGICSSYIRKRVPFHSTEKSGVATGEGCWREEMSMWVCRVLLT